MPKCGAEVACINIGHEVEAKVRILVALQRTHEEKTSYQATQQKVLETQSTSDRLRLAVLRLREMREQARGQMPK